MSHKIWNSLIKYFSFTYVIEKAKLTEINVFFKFFFDKIRIKLYGADYRDNNESVHELHEPHEGCVHELPEGCVNELREGCVHELHEGCVNELREGCVHKLHEGCVHVLHEGCVHELHEGCVN